MSCMCSVSPDTEIYAPDILTSSQKNRLMTLDDILDKNQLKRRQDSRLCFHFVMCGCHDIELQALVTYLKKADHLHNNCSFSEGYRRSRKLMPYHTRQLLDHSNYLSFVRRSVLITTEEREYPKFHNFRRWSAH